MIKPLTDEELKLLEETQDYVFAKKTKKKHVKFAKSRNHKEQKMLVDGKEVSVDKPLHKTIKWFNNFNGVKTHYCCQGSYDEKNINNDKFTFYYEEKLKEKFFSKPYVIFTCNSMDVFNQITATTYLFRAEIRTSYIEGVNRFYIIWPYKRFFDCFLRYIEGEENK